MPTRLCFLFIVVCVTTTPAWARQQTFKNKEENGAFPYALPTTVIPKHHGRGLDNLHNEIGATTSVVKKKKVWVPPPPPPAWKMVAPPKRYTKNPVMTTMNVFQGKRSGMKMSSKQKSGMSHSGKGYPYYYMKSHKKDYYRPMKPYYYYKMMMMMTTMNMAKGKGKGKPPTQPPTEMETTTIVTDISAASSENPLVRIALAQEESPVTVDLTLPGNDLVVEEVYVVSEQDVSIGSTCPPAGGVLVPTENADGSSLTTVQIELDPGVDSVVVLCVDGQVVAVSYYVFENFSTVGGGDVPTDEVRDYFFSCFDIALLWDGFAFADAFVMFAFNMKHSSRMPL